MRLLLIEDDLKIASFIANGFRQGGFAVDVMHNGDDGLYMALKEDYDIAIVDVMLPGKNGLEIIEEVRRQELTLPIIILSAKHSVEDRIKGLDTGSDDYLVKPFSFAELNSRVQALLRRSTTVKVERQTFEVGNLTLDVMKREVQRNGQVIDLQPREFSLLEYLIRNCGKVLSKTMILEHVWDYNFDPATNVVDVLVHRLRSKIDKDFDKKLIHTLRGVGYVLKSD
ncbi:response regulator transcription factor [bacterium]|nr:response regulator transcription factor [bacterium]